MTKKEVIKLVLDGKKPPYVPWDCKFTIEALEKMKAHYGEDVDIEKLVDNHFIKLGASSGFKTDIGNNRKKDIFGVIWKAWFYPNQQWKGMNSPTLTIRSFTKAWKKQSNCTPTSLSFTALALAYTSVTGAFAEWKTRSSIL